MSWKIPLRYRNSLAFRLTALYTITGVLAVVVVLGGSYFILKGQLTQQMDQSLLNEIEEYAALIAVQPLNVVRDVLDQEVMSEGSNTLFFRIFDADGKPIFATDLNAWAGSDSNRTHILAALQGRTVFENFQQTGEPFPARIVYSRISNGRVLQIGETTAGNALVLRHFRTVFFLVTLVLALCSLVTGWLLARSTLKSLQRVTRAARAISAGDWSCRVAVSDRGDEIDILALAFNEMIERIQVLVRELRNVSDDIAHDLRTPITRLRVAAENLLRRDAPRAEQEETAVVILESCDELLGLINTMLEISQTEAAGILDATVSVDYSALVEDVCDLFRPAAEDKGINFVTNIKPSVFVRGDIRTLRRALANIVDNAVKYTDADGEVSVLLDVQGARVATRVKDTGPGIHDEHIEKIFSRFYRVDSSRTEGGNGLGLSLSRAICRAHGGDVTVRSTVGVGSDFLMLLKGAEKKLEPSTRT